MTKFYSCAVLIFSLFIYKQALCQADTSGVIITDVTCNGGNNGSILYNITGGPGPIKYTWSNGVTGYATGNCTYAVTVNNPGAALTRFQIDVNVTLAAGMTANFSNIVFMDSAGNLFPFWLTDFPTAATASFWVRVPNIPPGTSVFYLSFCGNATTSASNPNTTFEFFDNFDGGSIAAYTDTCVNIDVGGESCTAAASNAQSFSPPYSAYLTGAASCFTPPYDGAGSSISRTITPVINDSLVIDYEDMVAVTLYGFCSGGTGTTNTVFDDDNNLGNGQSIGIGGSCATNTSGWRAETSLPFSVTTGTTTIKLQTLGGDCDNSQGWFDDVRIRKYRYNPPADTLLVTPQLSLDSLAAGTYTLTLTDITGNTVTRTIVVTQPAALQLIADSSNNTCTGSGNGIAWAVVSDGISPYSLLWSNTQTTDTVSSLFPGTYTVTATDHNGCTASAATHIVAVTPLQATAGGNNINCFATATGEAWVQASDGQVPYQYSWTNSAVTDTITGLTGGTYNVTVTDAGGCTAGATVTITQPASAFTTSCITSPITCFGYSNGMAWANSSGGTAPYHYLWNNGQSTDTLSNLSAGTYILTATDNAGCAETVTTIIPAPNPQLTISFDSVNELCNAGNNGSASAIVIGGTTPYSFHWSNNQSSASVTLLTAAAYNLTVTDSLGCTISGSVNITQPQPLNVTVIIHSPLCAGLSTGSADATASGGTAPYIYSWSTGSNSDSVSNLAPGPCSITVTDNNQCQKISQINVASDELITIAQQQITPTCADSAKGAVAITVSGGTLPYVYQWSNSATTQNISGLSAGNVSVIVTDNIGCSASFSANVPAENFTAGISASPDSVISAGGEVTLNVIGTGAASAEWQPFVTFNDNNGLSVTAGPEATTVYNVTATSGSGCLAYASIKITVNPKPQWLVPTGFSPNGDGVNDYFHIVLRGPVQFISLAVFNRWGQKIYESNDADPGWDGTFQERPEPVGVYIYQLQIRNMLNGANTIVTESGNVTLIR